MPERRSCARERIYEVNTEDLHEALNGICLACGEIQCGGVEPDARNYPCDACGADQVCGLEEALLVNRVTVADE